MADPLTDGPKDEKEIARFEKKARKKFRPRRVLRVAVVEGREGQDKTTMGI